MNICKSLGFTLIELLVTMAVLAIFLAIAIPDFTSSIQNNNIYSITNRLVYSLNYARSEAIKRGTNVSVCAANDTNFNSCGTNWNVGWIVFVNPTAGNSLTNPILRVEDASTLSSTITTSPSIKIATYNSAGFAANGTGNTSFTIKATGCTGSAGKNIAISLTGQASTTDVSCP